MNIYKIIMIVCAVLFSINNSVAQEHQNDHFDINNSKRVKNNSDFFRLNDDDYETKKLMIEVNNDIIKAAREANIDITPSLKKTFVDIAQSQSESVKCIYETIPEEKRVKRLASYLTIKANAGNKPSKLGFDYFKDFNWAYLGREISFKTMSLNSPKPAKLVKLEYADNTYNFNLINGEIQSGSIILIPSGYDKVSATFELGGQKAVWTGETTSKTMIIAYPRTEKACEIFIKSNPKNANVYFNGKKYYRNTNTTSVRDPGFWEVVIRLDGYEEWTDKREMSSGESWTIDALLIKNAK